MADKLEVKRLLDMIRLGRRILHPRKSPEWPEARRLATPEEIHRYCQHGERALAAVYGSETGPIIRFRQECARAFCSVAVETPRGCEEDAPTTSELADYDAFQKALDTLREAYRWAKKVEIHSSTEIAKAPSSPKAIASDESKFEQTGTQSPAAWQNVEIAFTSEERVQVRNGAELSTYNYADFGFEDRRNGKPNQAWLTLQALAERGGTINYGTRSTSNTPKGAQNREGERVSTMKSRGRGVAKLEKRIQEIRRMLRNRFGIDDDPLPLIPGVGYQARFKIGCSRSFDT